MRQLTGFQTSSGLNLNSLLVISILIISQLTMLKSLKMN